MHLRILAITCALLTCNCNNKHIEHKPAALDTSHQNPTVSELDFCTLPKYSKPEYGTGHLKNSEGQTIDIETSVKIFNNERIRQIIISLDSTLHDTFLLVDSTPRYALTLTSPHRKFLFFSEDSTRYNIGYPFDLDYTISYVTELRGIKSCSQNRIYHYSFLRTAEYLASDPGPGYFISKVYLDSHMNFLALVIKNKSTKKLFIPNR